MTIAANDVHQVTWCGIRKLFMFWLRGPAFPATGNASLLQPPAPIAGTSEPSTVSTKDC
jgi:hypothetical protein